jgi:hypothetical protein
MVQLALGELVFEFLVGGKRAEVRVLSRQKALARLHAD